MIKTLLTRYNLCKVIDIREVLQSVERKSTGLIMKEEGHSDENRKICKTHDGTF